MGRPAVLTPADVEVVPSACGRERQIWEGERLLFEDLPVAVPLEVALKIYNLGRRCGYVEGAEELRAEFRRLIAPAAEVGQ